MKTRQVGPFGKRHSSCLLHHFTDAHPFGYRDPRVNLIFGCIYKRRGIINRQNLHILDEIKFINQVSGLQPSLEDYSIAAPWLCLGLLIMQHICLLRGLYFPGKLQNHWTAFGNICQLSGTWVAPKSIFIDKKIPDFLE